MDASEEGADKAMLELPHVLDVKVSFLPVHNFTPQRSVEKSPFILPHENNTPLNPEQKWYNLAATRIDHASKPGFVKLANPELLTNQINQVDTVPLKPLDVETEPLSPIRPNYDPLPESQADPNEKPNKRKKNKKNKHNKKERSFEFPLQIVSTGLRGPNSKKFVFQWKGRDLGRGRSKHNRIKSSRGGCPGVA